MPGGTGCEGACAGCAGCERDCAGCDRVCAVCAGSCAKCDRVWLGVLRTDQLKPLLANNHTVLVLLLSKVKEFCFMSCHGHAMARGLQPIGFLALGLASDVALGLHLENSSGGLQFSPGAQIEYSWDHPRAQIHIATLGFSTDCP